MADAPEILPWNGFIWRGFHALTSSRQWTMSGAAAIPLSELIAWLNEAEVYDRDDRDELLQILRAMDRAYMGFVNKKAS